MNQHDTTAAERLRATGLVLVAGVLSALAMWAGLSGWGGFMEAADDFTGPLLTVSALVILVGTLVRGPWLTGSVLRRALVSLALQLVVVTGYLHHHVTGLWRPTRESLEQAAVSLYTGGVIAREQVAPVPAEYPEFVWLMVVIGAGLILAADLIAVGIREPAAAGLFVLGVVAVGASMLLQPVDAVRVVGAGAAWLALVAVTDLIRAPRTQRAADARGHRVVASTAVQVVVRAPAGSETEVARALEASAGDLAALPHVSGVAPQPQVSGDGTVSVLDVGVGMSASDERLPGVVAQVRDEADDIRAELADVPGAQEMIRQLVAGQEAVARTARAAFRIADAADDQPTAGMLANRMEVHEKNAWMLRAFLEQGAGHTQGEASSDSKN